MKFKNKEGWVRTSKKLWYGDESK